MTTAPDECPVEEKRTDGAPMTSDDAPAFFSLENLKVVQVQVVGGTLNGFAVAFVGVYANFYLTSTDCSLYKSPTACDTVANANCVWEAGKNVCEWEEFTCGLTYNTMDSCVPDKRCKWAYGDKICKNLTGFSAVHYGIFAGAMILGCMIGSVFAGKFVERFGHKVSFLVIGIVGVVSSVMFHASAAADQFWVLCVGRLLIGVVLGLVCVVCPMYVDQNAHPKYSKVDGVLFQVFNTFGIMFGSLMGLALGESIDFTKNTNMNGRMQAFCAFSTLLSVLMIALGIVLDESKTTFIGGAGAGEGALDPNEYSYFQMLGPLVMGCVSSATSQLTGINAVMNYAPMIMGNLGMKPLVGNAVVMIWNFLTTLLAIPLASCFTMRQLYVAGSFGAAVACLFLCGIPVYPGVANEKVKNGVAITGIAIAIGAFECGIGTCYFVLAQDLFPRSFRPKGSSFMIMFLFICIIIISVVYPIATEGISGGPSGNQDKGQAVAFIFFGSVGLVFSVVQAFFLFPWEESDAKAPAEEPPVDMSEPPVDISEHPPIEVSTPHNRQAA